MIPEKDAAEGVIDSLLGVSAAPDALCTCMQTPYHAHIYVPTVLKGMSIDHFKVTFSLTLMEYPNEAGCNYDVNEWFTRIASMDGDASRLYCIHV